MKPNKISLNKCDFKEGRITPFSSLKRSQRQTEEKRPKISGNKEENEQTCVSQMQIFYLNFYDDLMTSYLKE